MEEELIEQTKKQSEDKPWLFKKGQSGNPNGRPKGSGSMTLKQYAKEMLDKMTDDERQDFLAGIDKKTIWEMAESKPSQGIGQADDLNKLEVGVIILPQKNEDTVATTTETSDSPSV